MENCKTKLPMFLFGKSRLLILLSLLLFTGYGAQAQLDCESAEEISIGEIVSSSTTNASNNLETNCGLLDYKGPDVLYKIKEWKGGRMRVIFNVIGDDKQLDIVLFGSCNIDDCLNAATGVGNQGPARMSLSLEEGDYYLLIDGYQESGSDFTLKVIEETLDCSDIPPLEIGTPYPGSTSGKSNNVSAYCPVEGQLEPDQLNTGPEVVHEIEWYGGGFTATLDIKERRLDGEPPVYPYLDLILLSECDDIESCVNSDRGTGTPKKIEETNLPKGIYYLVVDGHGVPRDEEGNVNVIEGGYTLTVDRDVPPGPDYVVTNVTLNTNDPIIPGIPFTGTYLIENVGDATGGTYIFSQYLSTDEVKDTDDILLKTFRNIPLDPGGTYEGDPFVRTIPAGTPQGDYFLITTIIMDSGGQDAYLPNNEYTIPIRIGSSTPTLDCANAQTLTHLVKKEGNFSNASNNVSDYGNGENYTGREVVYSIDLPEALWGYNNDVFFDLEGDAERLILLSSCDPITPVSRPYTVVNGADGQIIGGSISNVPEGTYYVVVEGPENGSDGNFKLTVRRDHLACNDSKSITVGDEPTGPGRSVYDYVNHYCGAPNSISLKGNESVFEFDWDGGNLEVTLKDMKIMYPGGATDPWEDAALVLLENCKDPSSCKTDPVINNGESELIMKKDNLPEGKYYIVVDGVTETGDGINVKADFKIKVEKVQSNAKPDYIAVDFKLDGQDQNILNVTPGQSVSASVYARNIGEAAGTQNSSGKYYYSDDIQLSTDDILLGINDIEPLSPGLQTPENESIVIPENAQSGIKYIIYKVDADDEIAESNEDNNEIYLPITVGTDEGTCSNPIPLFCGKPYEGTTIGKPSNIEYYDCRTWLESGPEVFHQINWTGGGFEATISDLAGVDLDIFLLRDCEASTCFNYGDHGISINNLSAGIYYLVVDGFREAEGNYTLTINTSGECPEFTDYQPTDLRIRGGATTVAAGGTVVVDLNIKNNGSEDGQGQGGKDIYYLSTSTELSGIISTFSNEHVTANIPAGISWAVNSGPLNIPATTAPGTYYILFHHDAEGKVDESDETNNVGSVQITVGTQGSGLNVNFTANQTTICEGESVSFTSNFSLPSNIVYDQTINQNHGELKNMESPYEDRAGFGKALSFDGDDDYVELPEGLTTSLRSFTFETWYYYKGSRTWERIMDFGKGTSNYIMLAPKSDNGKPLFELRRNGGTKIRLRSSEALTVGNWYHFATVIDESSNTAKLYINGELIAEESTPFLLSDLGNLNQIWLGRSQFSDPKLQGSLDEVRIWSTARTRQQIQAYKDRPLTENERQGLIAYYNFDQEVGNAAYNWNIEKDGRTSFTSSDANPSFTFNESGAYRVSLTVVSDGQTESEVKEGYITVEDCSISTPDWTVTPSSDNHLVIIKSDAFITLNGPRISPGDYIGAFYYDNGSLKCAGKVKWTGEDLSMPVYRDEADSDEKEGFGIGESFQWKLWKTSTNQELYGTATYSVPSGIITHMGQFAVNGLSQIVSLEGTTQAPEIVEQTITLKPGSNLISSYIKSNAPDMAAIFESVQSNIRLVVDGENNQYRPDLGTNELGSWNIVKGYKVLLSGDIERQITLTGEKVDPSTTLIALEYGYNLIAYLQDTEEDIQTVMAPVVDEIVVIKDESGNSYLPALNINNVGNMKPGKGYWAHMQDATILNYNARMAAPPANMHTAQLMPAKYSITRRGTHNATVILDTKGLVAYGDEVGVFDKAGNLVGAATYEDHLMAFSIWGDDPTTNEIDGLEEGDEFEIRVWNKATQTENILEFNADVDMYTTHGMIQVELLRTTNVSTILEANSLKIYPNPTQNDATLSLELTAYASVQATLFDLTGKRVLDIVNENMAAGVHQSKISTDQLPAGLYHCRIIVDGVIHNIPLSVVK